jgi:D-alanyl-D-alanine carboxypeptidase
MNFKALSAFAIALFFISGFAKGQNINQARIETASAVTSKSALSNLTRELLDVFNRGERQKAASFVKEHLDDSMIEQSSEETLVNHILKIAKQSGGLEEIETVNAGENEIQILLRARRDGRQIWLKTFLSRTSNDKLRGFDVGLVPSETEKRARRYSELKLSEMEAIAEIRKTADQLATEDKLSGVLLIAKGDKILLHQSYGRMSQSSKAPNKTTTLFPAASMSKMFTAIAIAKLVESGKLSLDDTLEKVLPDYPDKDAARRIKIRHLLSHQSGLGNFFNDTYRRNPERYVRPSDYYPLFANKPLFFEPGTKMSYSNAGMVVLGAVVEQVGKMKFEDFLKENIFKPAGMKKTFYNPSDASKNLIANLHSRFESNDPLNFEPRKENSDHRIASPAGGSYTTASDMLRFIRALQKGKIVKAETLKQFTVPASGVPGNYAFGFESFVKNGKAGYGHSGGAPGVNTNTMTFADGSYTVSVLTNYDPGFAQNLVRDIVSLLANVEPKK